MPEGMLHDMLSLELLQKIYMREGQTPPHIALWTNTYINDTNKMTKMTSTHD